MLRLIIIVLVLVINSSSSSSKIIIIIINLMDHPIRLYFSSLIVKINT